MRGTRGVIPPCAQGAVRVIHRPHSQNPFKTALQDTLSNELEVGTGEKGEG